MTDELDPTVIEATDSQTTVEEDTETAAEVVEVDNAPTLEDYEALKRTQQRTYEKMKKLEAIAKQARASEPLKKLNDTGLTREEVILYAKGYTDEEVKLALKLSKVEGTNPLVVAESDDYFKTKVSERQKKEKSALASLPASSGSGRYTPPKPVGEMTEEEHQAYFREVMDNV